MHLALPVLWTSLALAAADDAPPADPPPADAPPPDAPPPETPLPKEGRMIHVDGPTMAAAGGMALVSIALYGAAEASRAQLGRTTTSADDIARIAHRSNALQATSIAFGGIAIAGGGAAFVVGTFR